MSKARDLADFIADSTVATAEIADDAVTPAKVDETGSYTVAGLTTTGFTLGGVALTATGTELNYTDGVTSAIQTQLDGKATSAQGANADTAYGWGDHSTQNYAVTTGDTMTGNLYFGDSNKSIFGAGNDLQIYHDGSHSYIQDSGTGNLRLCGDNLNIMNAAATENYIACFPNAQVDIKYDNATKLTTTSGGVTVTGTVTADGVSLGDNEKAQFGASNDLQIYHDGSNSWIRDEGTGALYIRASTELALQSATGDNYLQAIADGTTSLFYDHATKLATTSDGVDITGEIYANRGRGATQTSSIGAGSYQLQLNNYTNFVWTISGAITLTNPGTEAVGQSGVLVFIHSGGGQTVSIGTDFETVGGAGLTLSGTAGATDIVPYFVAATNRIILGQPLLAVS